MFCGEKAERTYEKDTSILKHSLNLQPIIITLQNLLIRKTLIPKIWQGELGGKGEVSRRFLWMTIIYF